MKPKQNRRKRGRIGVGGGATGLLTKNIKHNRIKFAFLGVGLK